MPVPETSTTLLRDLKDAQHARWGEFVERYRPMMEAYMRERFPSVEADDVIQETLVALCRIFPDYRYAPDEKGHFHNYLTGILRNKAIRAAKSESRRADALEIAARGGESAPSSSEGDRAAWRKSVFEIALRQLLADESVQERTREVFRRIAVNGEKPEDVGLSLGVSRNAIDQMKSRMMARLKKIVRSLEEIDGVEPALR